MLGKKWQKRTHLLKNPKKSINKSIKKYCHFFCQLSSLGELEGLF